MLLIIISIVLAAITFTALGFYKRVPSSSYVRGGFEWKLRRLQILAVLPLLLISLNLIAIVPANTVGVVYSPFSGVREETLSEGWQIKGIFDTVYKISTEVQSQTLLGITGQTKDSQYIEMDIDVKYQVDTTNAYEIFRQYRTLKNVAANLLPPTVQRAIETVSTGYNVIDILGEERNALYAGIEAELTNRLSSNGITFISINFNDTDAGQAIELAIQAEAVAKKAAETAGQELLKVKTEAQQSVVQAEAAAQKAVVQAESNKAVATINAEITEINTAAEAARYKAISDAITDNLLLKWEMDARIAHGWVTVQGGAVITDTTK